MRRGRITLSLFFCSCGDAPGSAHGAPIRWRGFLCIRKCPGEVGHGLPYCYWWSLVSTYPFKVKDCKWETDRPINQSPNSRRCQACGLKVYPGSVRFFVRTYVLSACQFRRFISNAVGPLETRTIVVIPLRSRGQMPRLPRKGREEKALGLVVGPSCHENFFENPVEAGNPGAWHALSSVTENQGAR